MAQVRLKFYPQVDSLSELARLVSGPRAALFTRAIFLACFFSLTTYFLVASTEAFVGIVGQGWCSATLSVVVAVMLALPLQLTTLTHISYLALPSTVAVIVALILTLVFMEGEGAGGVNSTYSGTSIGVPPSGKHGFVAFLAVAAPLSSIIFAFAGQPQFYEMMAEMRTPSQFPCAAAVAYTVMLVAYLVAVIIAYGQRGDRVADFLPDSLPDGPVKQAVGSLVLFHTLVAYLIIANSLHLPVYGMLFPRTPLGSGCGARARWLALTTATLLAAVLLGNLVPFFSDLQGLVGALFVTPSFFFYPAWGYVRAHALHAEAISLVDTVVCHASMYVIFPVLLILGTIDSVQGLIKGAQTSAAPFSCS